MRTRLGRAFARGHFRRFESGGDSPKGRLIERPRRKRLAALKHQALWLNHVRVDYPDHHLATNRISPDQTSRIAVITIRV